MCLPGQEIKVSLEEGIPVVYNLRQPLASAGVPHKFILVPDLIIASKGKGKKGAFDSVSDIRSDKSGNIYIFEAENQRIQIFSGTGIHINSIILADEDVQENEISKEFCLVGGHIIIVGRKSIIRYSPEGQLVERISNPLSTLSLKPDSKGNFIGICWQTADRNTMVLAKYDSLLWLIYEIDRIEQDRSFNENEMERFPPIAFTLTADDEIIWGRNYQYVINISNPEGQKIRKIVKEWDPIAYTRDDIEKFLQKRQESGVDIQKYRFPDHFPAFGDIHTDEYGRIFVGIYEMKRESHRQFDVFDSGGRYISRIQLPNIPFCFQNGMLYCSEKNKKGIQVIYRFKVRWK